jgi:hypothetical protein
MFPKASTLLSAVLVTFTTAGLVAAAPPRVAHAVPDHADIAVDPSLTEIRITFDQDMNPGGRSICGGGPTFPTIDGTISWTDPRTIVIPVKLESGRTYTLSVNCPGAQNFRSAAGEVAEIHPISFSTRTVGQSAPVLSTEAARRLSTNLRKAIDTRYSYRNLRKLDWDALFKQREDSLIGATTPSEFARAAASLLSEAKDTHITLQIGGFTLGTHRPGVTPNGDFKLLSKLITDWKPAGPHAFSGSFEGLPYLLISDWSGKAPDYDPVFAFLAAHKDAAGIIIDARFNSGGDELLARAVAGCFVTAPTVYSKNTSVDPYSPSGWSKDVNRTVEPNPDHPHFAGRVAVLMGPFCMSSNESFLLMMREGAKATLMGSRSYGSSGNPRPVELGSGITVRLPSWIDMEPSKREIEGVGINPTVAVEWKMGSDDPLLTAAVKFLKPN